MLLRAATLAVSYGNKTILNNIDLTLYSNERVGVIGANGVGKSTLLRVLAGEHTPESGTIEIADGVDLGYLPQEVRTTPGQTVQDLIDDALAHFHHLSDQLRYLEAQMAVPTADLDQVFSDYNLVTEAFERAGGYEADARVAEVLAGLQVDHIPRERELATLSGGERSRLSLAAMLARAPEVLLLDEPTNHIDAATLGWLEATLAAYRGGILLVSHDRAFLNATVNRIIEIDWHTREAVHYSGDYDAYAEVKAIQLERWRQDYADQQEEIKQLQTVLKSKRASASGKRNIRSSDGDKFIKHFKGQTADKTMSRDIGAVEARLERIQADPVLRPPKQLVISPELDSSALYGEGFPVIVSNVCKRFGERSVLAGVSFTVGARERIAITGPNGAGKSTLLKILVGEVMPDDGGVTLAGAVQLGYLPQTDDLPPGETLIEAYGYGLDGDYEDHKADLISSGLFRYPELNAPVSGLSAGQRRKVQLARLSISGANVLLLDEPTNHLSFDVLEGFEAALADFPGVVIAVSHDRRFLERFGGREMRL